MNLILIILALLGIESGFGAEINSNEHKNIGRGPQFLNTKTRKYKVNGKALPLVDFDIGESYSGLLPIDDTGRELFFWFFPTQGTGQKDITIWLNGGPGCSSLQGLLEENGPFVWRPGTYGPTRNPYSLNKLSNVVYVEQPVGTGFSKGSPNATNEVEVAEQFIAFWKKFIDLFELKKHNVYISGESYAGKYVPYIADQMIKDGGKKYFNLKGILIYDPEIGKARTDLPSAVPFAQYNFPSFPFDTAVWNNLNQLQHDCGYDKIMKAGLTFPPKRKLPKIHYNSTCDTVSLIFEEVLKVNPCFNIYYSGAICPTVGDILDGPEGPKGNRIPVLSEAYFNRTDVKRVIHAPMDVTWRACGGNVLDKDTSPPSGSQGGPIQHVAEKIGNVFVGHGLQDFALFANQTLLTLNDLVWNGMQGFENGPSTPLIIPQGLSKAQADKYVRIGSWTSSRGITFIEVELSGHMVPQYNPRANYRINEVFLGRVPNLSAKEPFTGQ